MKLCSFKHENMNVHEKDVMLRQKRRLVLTFDSNLKNNFPEIFENYLQNNKTVQCYFCNFRTKSQNIRNIKSEVNNHLKTEHREVINTLEVEKMVIENLFYAEFLELFGTDW